MKPLSLSDYGDSYEHVRLSRENGVLTARLHTDDAELKWGAGPHDELGNCFYNIGNDPENEVVVLTGTGAAFCAHLDFGNATSRTPQAWAHVHAEGKRLLMNLLDIPVPMVAAINGPATVHAELGLLCDIVLASSATHFQDGPHYPSGLVPGDGVQIIWPLLLGPNRGRTFLLTGQSISAKEALELGVVAEVTEPADLMNRAREVAEDILETPPLTRRFTREVLTQRLKRELSYDLSLGLAVEGLAAADNWPGGSVVDDPAYKDN